MAKFITVLNADLNKTFWKAVQWDETLTGIRANSFYSADINMAMPKNGDTQVEGKVVTETVTGRTANATIVRLNTATANMVKVSANTASKNFINKVAKALSK